MSLKILREVFLSLNQDLVEKIEESKKTGRFCFALGSHHYDYKIYSEILQDGFVSPRLEELFEGMMHIYFFRACCDMSFDLFEYVRDSEFLEEDFINKGRETAEVIVALNQTQRRVEELLPSLGIRDLSLLEPGVRSEYGSLKDALDSVRSAKGTSLHLSGDHMFIVSRIHRTGKPYEFDPEVTLANSLIYTYKPDQIIQLAHVAKPGVYLIANVPQDKVVETAFYFLFVTDGGDAYLVDSNKHSYRDQIYRTKTDGTNGEQAWLEHLYSSCALPIEQVIEFFEKRSDNRDLIVSKDGMSFKHIMKLSDCSPHTVLWCHAFVDQCIQQFRDTNILTAASPTMCLRHIRKGIRSAQNLPALYTDSVPTLSDIDVTWSPEYVQVKSLASAVSLSEGMPTLPLEKVDLGCSGDALTSMRHIRGQVMYAKREQEAKELGKRLDEDFLENYSEVMEKMSVLIQEKHDTIIKRAMKDKSYRSAKASKN